MSAQTKVVSAVEEAILQAEIGNVAKNPAPNCVLMDIDKGYARYALRYWLTDLAADDPTDGAVRWHVYTALKRAGIKLAVEEQNVHYVRENEKYEEAEHQRELMRRVKTLKRVELFKQMTDDELNKLAARLKYAPFAKGNVITKQGATAQHWLFVIINGETEVYLEAPNGEKRSLNVLAKGDFFGEMSLMTGAAARGFCARQDGCGMLPARQGGFRGDHAGAPEHRRGSVAYPGRAPCTTGQCDAEYGRGIAEQGEPSPGQ